MSFFCDGGRAPGCAVGRLAVCCALALLFASSACSRSRKGPTTPLAPKPPDLLAGGTGGAASFTAHACAALVPRASSLTFLGALDVGELTTSKFWPAVLPFLAQLAPTPADPTAVAPNALRKDTRLMVFAESTSRAPIDGTPLPGAPVPAVATLKVGLSASAELAGAEVIAPLRREGACVTTAGSLARPAGATTNPAASPLVLPEVAVALLDRLPAGAPLRAVFLRSPNLAPASLAPLLQGTLGSGVAAFELGDNVRVAWVIHAQGAPEAQVLAASLRRTLTSSGRSPVAPTRYERVMHSLLRSAVVHARGAFVALQAEFPGGLLKTLVARGP